ncbi:MAG: class I SAM-dependent methyltransferase [Burkholderiales bacterium]
MTDLQAYLRPYGCTNPARMAIRRGAGMLVEAMGRYLSGRVLDIGCGSKSKRFLASDRVVEYVGLDHEASVHDKSLVDIFGTAYRIPQPDSSFDGAVCTAVLEHLEEPRAALAECLRVLKPGGHAVYTVPLYWHLHEEPRDFYRYTEHGLRYLFEGAGFQVVELVPASGFWLTFGCAWSYYLHSIARGPFRLPVRLAIAVNNLFFPWLDGCDRRFNRDSRRFTWMYLVVARRPA